MKFLGKLEKNTNFWFLFITSVVFFFLRLPSLFEPYWYGDEGVYQVLGMGIRSGRLLYRDIFDNKPPLLYNLYAFFGSDQFWVRSANLVFGILTVIVIFYLAKKLLKSKLAVYVSTIFFAFFFGIPLLEGNIANAENFMLLPITIAGLLIFNHFEKAQKSKKIFSKTHLYIFVSGLLVGIALLFKIVALFDFAAFFCFLLISDTDFKLGRIMDKKYFLNYFRYLLSFTIGFLIPLLLTTAVFFLNGAFTDFIRAIFFSNIGYVGYGNKFIIPQGLLILKLLALALFILFIFAKRNKLTMPGVFIYIWFAFSLYNAFFSQRPYTHYVLVLLPSFSLLLGFLISEKSVRRFSTVILGICLILVVTNFGFFTKTIYYYQSFLSLTAGGSKSSAYQRFFDRNTPVDYEIAQYLNSRISDNDHIFIWGNNAQLYKLTNKLPPGKYTVAYHITNYNDGISNTQQALEKNKPKYLILMPNVGNYPFSLSGYNLRIIIGKIQIYERVL